jgi:hypothetical protein
MISKETMINTTDSFDIASLLLQHFLFPSSI